MEYLLEGCPDVLREVVSNHETGDEVTLLQEAIAEGLSSVFEVHLHVCEIQCYNIVQVMSIYAHCGKLIVM